MRNSSIVSSLQRRSLPKRAYLFVSRTIKRYKRSVKNNSKKSQYNSPLNSLQTVLPLIPLNVTFYKFIFLAVRFSFAVSTCKEREWHVQIRFLLRLKRKNPTPHLLNHENRKQTPFLKSNGRKSSISNYQQTAHEIRSNRFDRRVYHYCFCRQLFYPPIGLYFSTRPHSLMGVFWTH